MEDRKLESLLKKALHTYEKPAPMLIERVKLRLSEAGICLSEAQKPQNTVIDRLLKWFRRL